jgi:uncharacterized protein
MVTAAPEEQLKLLAVQQHASRLRQLARQRAEAAQDPALAAAAQALADARAVAAEAEARRGEADAAVEALETQAATVAARIAKDEAQLIAGQAGAGTLQGLQREIESLSAKASELEDAEIEALDAAEAAAGEQAGADAAVAAAEAANEAVRSDVRERIAGLDAEAASAQADRDAAAALVQADLLALFEATLQRRGAGAARLFHGTSEGSGLSLAPVELAEIKRAAPDAVVLCPDSGVILVRHPDWM